MLLKALVPETSVSTNSTIWANDYSILQTVKKVNFPKDQHVSKNLYSKLQIHDIMDLFLLTRELVKAA